MSKARDWVEWQYIRDLMLKLGFLARWVELIMICISTMSFNVLHNGEEIGPIIPRRGTMARRSPFTLFIYNLC